MSYLLPYSSRTVVHVNAADLNNGTALAGAAWTKIGSPALVAPALLNPQGVSGFSNSTYFAQAAASFPSLGSGPWTAACLCKFDNLSNSQQLLLSAPPGDASTWYLEFLNGAFYFFGPNIQIGSGVIGYGYSTHLVMWGVDGSGTAWLGVDQLAPVTGAFGLPQGNTGSAVLGGYAGGAQQWGGVIYELLISTDAPSAALFASIYATVSAGGPGPTPTVPQTPEMDVATYLSTAGLGLMLGTNLYTGAVLPANVDGHQGNVPGLSVFVNSVGGPPPLPYMGPAATAGSLYSHGIQVRVRGYPDAQAAGLVLARQVRNALHRATIPGYLFCLVKESQPLYLGVDANNRHQWSINVDLRSYTTP